MPDEELEARVADLEAELASLHQEYENELRELRTDLDALSDEFLDHVQEGTNAGV